MCGGGLMQIIACGSMDVYLLNYDGLRYHNGYSTTLYKGKYKKFTGKNNFYEHLKKSDTKASKKTSINKDNKSKRRLK